MSFCEIAARMRFQAIAEPKQMSTQPVLELIVGFSFIHSIRVGVYCQEQTNVEVSSLLPKPEIDTDLSRFVRRRNLQLLWAGLPNRYERYICSTDQFWHCRAAWRCAFAASLAKGLSRGAG